ncbi:hypothetical protein BGZ95_011713 [Linnemannia exigua]|uniref:Uncharacterized protein n=1 Tax=Linnemannia exigua TaxID=604196 RepID=A0AAD4DJR1_9FUNG|nr:hypothetical protein BGZ95_011713 [Linnemannia exigua]
MTATETAAISSKGQDKKHIHDAFGSHLESNLDPSILSLSQLLPAYPRPIATPQQFYATAAAPTGAAPTAPSSYHHRQTEPLPYGYTQLEHFTSPQNYTSYSNNFIDNRGSNRYNYNGYNYSNNYFNNNTTSRMYPTIHTQEEIALKGDYPRYVDGFTEEIGYKGEYPPYVDDGTLEEKPHGQGKGDRGARGEAREVAEGESGDGIAVQACKETPYRPKTFFMNARSFRRTEFWIIAVFAATLLLGTVMGGIMAGKGNNNNNSGGSDDGNNGSSSESGRGTRTTSGAGGGNATGTQGPIITSMTTGTEGGTTTPFIAPMPTTTTIGLDPQPTTTMDTTIAITIPATTPATTTTTTTTTAAATTTSTSTMVTMTTVPMNTQPSPPSVSPTPTNL